ncbi:AfsR/SARP family transcriptional regulator [Actinomadura kijaniata]|uniref:AfsR/SARP family transcriptional regulator n=1 Tax=Actinomadura kijaniata TaxID=46161 RepID=UPI003F1A8178
MEQSTHDMRITIFIRVLDAFTAEVSGAAVLPDRPRQRSMLALLVAARGQVVPVDRLIEDLWRGEPPAWALLSLHA